MNPSPATSVAAVLLEIPLCPLPWLSSSWHLNCLEEKLLLIYPFVAQQLSAFKIRFCTADSCAVCVRIGDLNVFNATKSGTVHLCSLCGIFMNRGVGWGGGVGDRGTQYVSNNSLLPFRSSCSEGSDPERSPSDLTNPSGHCLSKEMSLTLCSEC